MRILHLLYESEGDYFGLGGVGVRAYEIYRYLKDHHEITLLSKKYPGAKDGEIEGLEHIFAGCESKSLTETLLRYAYHASLFVKRHSQEFDIIVEEFSPAIPTLLPLFAKKPVVLQIQGHTGMLYFRKYNPLYAAILSLTENIMPMLYDNFIFISGETVKKLSLNNRKNVEIIPNGISPELLDIRPIDGNYILYFGRIDIYGKGLDILIRAFAEFHKSFEDIRLVVAGDGRDMKAFKDLLMCLPEQMRGNIDLIGWVSGDRKKEVIRGASYVVCPSRHEVQPIAALEALAAGKAVIVSDIAEFGFVTENGAGISFRSGDEASLARCMREFAVRQDLSGMGQRGRDLVKDYTWDKAAAKFEKFLYRTADATL
jgi:glycogen(starch) synthase